MLKNLHYFFFIVISILLLSGVNEYLSFVSGQAEVISLVILILVFLLLFLKVAEQGKISFRYPGLIDKSFVNAVAAYIFIGVIMAWSGGNGSAAYWGIRYYIPSLLVFLIINQSLSKLNYEIGIDRIIRLFRNIILINAILSLLDYGSQGSLGLFHEEGRYSGLISNANDAGFLFNILLILNFHIFRRKENLISLVGVFLSAAAVFITFSKTAIICAVVILIMILGGELRKGKILNRYLILIFLGFLFYKGAALASQFENLEETQFERLSQVLEFFKGNIDNKVTTNRTEILDAAFEQLKGNWLFGQGIQSYSNIESIGIGVHNIYVLILGESGIIPLLLYLFFLARLAMITSRSYWNLNGATTVRLLAFALLLYGFTNHNIFFSKFIIIIIALGVVLVTEIRRESSRSNQIMKL